MKIKKASWPCILVFLLADFPGSHADAAQVRLYCGDTDRVSCARKLLSNGQYRIVAEIFPPEPRDSSELDFCRGMALAGLGRLEQAKGAFESGQKKAPSDKRFPLELAGVAFKLGNLSEARRHLERALKADPRDTYGNDFLATIYFLQGNLEASLKYWNHIGKPRIEKVETVPAPKMDPVLLDRIFAFSPESLLTLREFSSTQARLDFTGVFSAHRVELLPRQDDSFDLRLHALERAGAGNPVPMRLLSILKEAPFQTVHLDFFDLGGSASNFQAFYRWDAQKRRAFASYSRPVKGNPALRLRLWVDGRDENWSLAPQASPMRFKLQKLDLGAGISSLISDTWEWQAGVSVSDRRFPVTSFEGDVPSGLVDGGVFLDYEGAVRHKLLDLPERRAEAGLNFRFKTARALNGYTRPYAKMEIGLDWNWLPRARGEDYRFSGRLRAGGIVGQPPVDELFALGIERDNDLYLRGHPGTHEGMKGNGPFGRSFVLLNCEMDKAIHDWGLWKISLGPFLDVGKVSGGSGSFGSRQILWDAGIQSKIAILQGLTLALSYGWDLRSGRAAFYPRLLRSGSIP